MRIRNVFEEFFCLRSNISNDNIISTKSLGLKTGVVNYFFFCLKQGQDFENQAAHPHQEFPGVPLPRVLAIGETPHGTSSSNGLQVYILDGDIQSTNLSSKNDRSNLQISFLIYQILCYLLSILSLFLSEDNCYSLNVLEQSDEAPPKLGS